MKETKKARLERLRTRRRELMAKLQDLQAEPYKRNAEFKKDMVRQDIQAITNKIEELKGAK